MQQVGVADHLLSPRPTCSPAPVAPELIERLQAINAAARSASRRRALSRSRCGRRCRRGAEAPAPRRGSAGRSTAAPRGCRRGTTPRHRDGITLVRASCATSRCRATAFVLAGHGDRDARRRPAARQGHRESRRAAGSPAGVPRRAAPVPAARVAARLAGAGPAHADRLHHPRRRRARRSTRPLDVLVRRHARKGAAVRPATNPSRNTNGDTMRLLEFLAAAAAVGMALAPASGAAAGQVPRAGRTIKHRRALRRRRRGRQRGAPARRAAAQAARRDGDRREPRRRQRHASAARPCRPRRPTATRCCSRPPRTCWPSRC